MRNRLLLVAFLLFPYNSTGAVMPDAWPLDTPKYSRITVKIPTSLLGFEKYNAWRGTFNYTALISQASDGRIEVNSIANWRERGWPLMVTLSLEKVSRNRQYTEVELRTGQSNVKLRFVSGVKDLNAAFKEVAFIGRAETFEGSDYYKTEVMGRFLPTVFKGPLAKLPVERQLAMVKAVNYDLAAIHGEDFKGRFYLAAKMGTGEIYNSIQLDQSERVRHVLSKLLPGLKETALFLATNSDIEGLKFEIPIAYRNFVTEQHLSPYVDELHLYLPGSEIQKFVANDITNQELLDASIALLNGSRIKVTF